MAETRYPFEVPYSEITADISPFVDAVCATLQSSFLTMPRGAGFVTYADFQRAYEVLKRHTSGFTILEPDDIVAAIQEDILTYIVLRTILGFSPSELAYMASNEHKTQISQAFTRSLERRIRIERQEFRSLSEQDRKRIWKLVSTSCQLLKEGAPDAPANVIHRLDKADTRLGPSSLRHLAAEGVPYAMLLYERFLGRPFATHRDSVSELVGDIMESAVEEQLRQAGISFRKTKRAERLEGFDQAPDFIVPDEWNSSAVIEAKITEDDGTARDKVTRIQHLGEISQRRRSQGRASFQVIACIDGRGFGIRREDMRKLIEATQGKVFTLKTLDRLVDNTVLGTFRTRDSPNPS